MTFPRRLEPEWLDELPPDDPRAVRTRRDLRRVNAWMLNASRMAGALLRHADHRQPCRIVDLGSGDGEFMLRVGRRVAPRIRDVTIILQDRQDIVAAETRQAFAALGWKVETHSCDVFDFVANAPPTDIVTCNLFLHHFTDEQLSGLFAKLAGLAGLVVACEPRRARFVVRASRLLWLIGCNEVSIHDAVVSARAGFTGQDLSGLWPGRAGWELEEGQAGLFTHAFVARRTAPSPMAPRAPG